MKRLLARVMAFALLANAPVAADFSILTGDWIMVDNGRTTREHWDAPLNGGITGHAAARGGGRADFSETMRIARGAKDDFILWVRQMGDAAETPFRMVRSDGQQLMFENPAHDYPQRIIYARDENLLFAEIMKLDGSNSVGFVYRPAASPPLPKGVVLPSAAHIAKALGFARRCIDDGETLCNPPFKIIVRNMTCLPRKEFTRPIQGFDRSYGSFQCVFESSRLNLGPRAKGQRKPVWGIDYTDISFVETRKGCTARRCKPDWYIRPD